MQGLLPVLYGCMLAENERGAGEWPAEWETIRDLLNITATSAQRSAMTLANLVIDEGKMLDNLKLSRGNVMSERVLTKLSMKLGRIAAYDLVREAANRSTLNQSTLHEELIKLEAFRDSFSADEALELFDPLTYLGSAQTFINNALERWQVALPGWRRIAMDEKA
jgi:3-carboxy-cis,cis-muconate cycloisomerase